MMNAFDVKDPYWFVGKDIIWMRRLMFHKRVAEVSGMANQEQPGGAKKLTEGDLALWEFLEQWREEDNFLHGR